MQADQLSRDLCATTSQLLKNAFVCMALQRAAGDEQSARETAERLGGRVETLEGATAELERQLKQQSRQLSSQAAELDSTRLKLNESQVSFHVFV